MTGWRCLLPTARHPKPKHKVLPLFTAHLSYVLEYLQRPLEAAINPANLRVRARGPKRCAGNHAAAAFIAVVMCGGPRLATRDTSCLLHLPC